MPKILFVSSKTVNATCLKTVHSTSLKKCILETYYNENQHIHKFPKQSETKNNHLSEYAALPKLSSSDFSVKHSDKTASGNDNYFDTEMSQNSISTKTETEDSEYYNNVKEIIGNLTILPDIQELDV